MGRRPYAPGRRRRPPPRKLSLASLLVIIFLAALFVAAWENGMLGEVPGSEPASTGNVETVLPAGGNPAGDGLEVYFLDVGQGDSELIRIPNGEEDFHVLIDTGEYAYADGLTEMLCSLGVEKIDALICTHPHTDHMGCMARIVQRFDIGAIYMPRLPDDQVPTTSAYEALLNAIEEKKLRVKALRAGTKISCPEGASFEVSAPEKDAVWEGINNYSGVIRLTYGETTFLFTGDAEKQSEKKILESGVELKADVLKCGHHGSSTSTSQKFLQAVEPAYVVISCGKDNSYGHPHQETMESLTESGARIYRTDEDGTVLARSDGSSVTFETGLPSVKEKEWN